MGVFHKLLGYGGAPLDDRAVFQIGYEFEPQIAKKLGLSGLRLNAYMNDIFRLSSIKEERGTAYPFARNVSFALSFTL